MQHKGSKQKGTGPTSLLRPSPLQTLVSNRGPNDKDQEKVVTGSKVQSGIMRPVNENYNSLIVDSMEIESQHKGDNNMEGEHTVKGNNKPL